MKTSSRATILVSVIGAIIAGVVGCQSAPPDNGLLLQAREAVSQAEANPNVTKYAATELGRARQLLTNAEGSAKEKGASGVVTSHYAYLAAQTAHIAEQRALEQVAMERIKSGEVDRQKILVSARETEAQNATAAAQQARAETQNAQAQVAQAQQETQRMAAQLENMQASQTERGIVLTLDDVLFDTGRAELKSGAQRSLAQVADFLEKNPERQVQVEGFTDSQGADEYNLQLSQRRADAVAEAIVQRGIDAQRVRAKGYGEEYPVATNNNAGSRQLNRRVEIVISRDDKGIPGRSGSGAP